MNEQALEAFYLKLDRSLFLDDGYKAFAKNDHPLPIGYGQTISQPSLVLEMTRLLAPEKDSKVLEIGTGSGYQTALLAEFCKQVYTIERIGELSRKARERLEALGYGNIHYKVDDGSAGWEEEAPFDRIMITAAAGKRPQALINQLANGGRMVVPVGPPAMQVLLLITKDEAGQLSEQKWGHVKFVEMVGPYGWD
ncbi:MAG TPA: protein-L-isoaspartate(D-aspartate) O-methyltransferase [Bacillota bacterium]|jgi:protein-L-isoaspartate(D-aspartate) O-methyltransferase|nr:protein-L-isoaspartate(D-aspartate) O-methyltransferase [Fastidiosipila sp.]HPX92586.1 protein-L-isoaspartate(D-aspartate) O-methyltransferase [Bacillota bacterium]HQB81146.1 protein-L-isoaspartate(D-aspartate) O-methyltransferase [Bacillota bacterium]